MWYDIQRGDRVVACAVIYYHIIMLSTNNMLTTGGSRSRQRARHSVRVSEPAYGFFITGSCIAGMNGVYVRKNWPTPTAATRSPPPATTNCGDGDDGNNDDVVEEETRAAGTPALYYQHEDGLWTMTLNTLKLSDSNKKDEEDEDDEYSYYHRYTTKKKVKTHAWFIVDEFNKERFTHDGDTIVPGAGTRWKHVPASGFTLDDISDNDNDGSPYYNNPYTGLGRTHRRGKREKTRADNSTSTTTSTTALSNIDPPNDDELPWQVIAILDVDMVHQLLYSSKCRKERVRASMAGKSAESPATKSLECIFNPGRWLFRVICNDGVMLYTTPSLAKESNEYAAGTRKQGEYVRGVELRQGKDDGSSLWLKLEACDFLAHGYLSNNFEGGMMEESCNLQCYCILLVGPMDQSNLILQLVFLQYTKVGLYSPGVMVPSNPERRILNLIFARVKDHGKSFWAREALISNCFESCHFGRGGGFAACRNGGGFAACRGGGGVAACCGGGGVAAVVL